MMAKKLNRRQACWSLYLSRFDFSLHHHLGHSMGKTNALSQCADHGDGGNDNQDIMLLQPNLFTIWALEGIAPQGKEQDILCDIHHANHSGLH